jgi:hypothetical protein
LTPLPHDPGPHWGEVGIHGLHRQREWDAVGSVAGPGAPGDETSLVALADGRTLLEEGAPADADLLASALRLERPFRARAVHREDGVWAVAGRRIEVVSLARPTAGTAVEVVWDGVELVTTVDGASAAERFPELEQLGASRFETYVVRAVRVTDGLWEVSVLPL